MGFEFDSFVYELKQINDFGDESLDCSQNRVGLVRKIQLVFDVGIVTFLQLVFLICSKSVLCAIKVIPRITATSNFSVLPRREALRPLPCIVPCVSRIVWDAM